MTFCVYMIYRNINPVRPISIYRLIHKGFQYWIIMSCMNQWSLYNITVYTNCIKSTTRGFLHCRDVSHPSLSASAFEHRSPPNRSRRHLPGPKINEGKRFTITNTVIVFLNYIFYMVFSNKTCPSKRSSTYLQYGIFFPILFFQLFLKSPKTEPIGTSSQLVRW